MLEKVYALFPRLKEREKQQAGTLSGGEQQMAAIGRGLMSKPRLLMLDEPSLGLSPLLVGEIFRVLGEVHEAGVTVLLVEQNVFKTLSVADRAYVLENGRIVLEGTGSDLLANPHIRQAYLGI
jgi:branched-chain amino acid transport system ATP-binding protein